MSRHFHVRGSLEVGLDVELDAARFVRVLRRRVGDVITVCDQDARLFEVVVASLEPCVGRVTRSMNDPRTDALSHLVVWLPMLKGGRSDDLVRQLTELGVSEIRPFQSQNSVVALDGKKARERQARFQSIASEAANQCGRLRIPVVTALETAIPNTPLDGVVPALTTGSGGRLPRESQAPVGIFFWEVQGRPLSELPAYLAECSGSLPDRGSRSSEPETSLDATDNDRGSHARAADNKAPLHPRAAGFESDRGSQSGEKRDRSQSGPPSKARTVTALFGPEGGITEAEAVRLVDAGWTPFSLGRRILRAETAVVAGTTLIQAALGALDS